MSKLCLKTGFKIKMQFLKSSFLSLENKNKSRIILLLNYKSFRKIINVNSDEVKTKGTTYI